MNAPQNFDVVIIGGGMVGASMACALAELPLNIAVVEAFPFRSDTQPSYDARSIALSYGSKRIFDSLGIWQAMAKESSAIKQIHVSSRGQFGVTVLNAQEEGINALGYVIENRVIGKALFEQIESKNNITLFCPASLVDLTSNDSDINATLNINKDERKIQCKLLIAADGGNSKVRQILNIDSTFKDYEQTAVISNVTPGKPHNNIAYERFTSHGPIAVLPMTENRCSLVYTVRSEDADRVLGLSDSEFIKLLEQQFGFRTGGFTHTSRRHAYPLSLMKTKQHFRQRCVIIGNAAHTLHPIAGQGFNLGMRDVSALADVVRQALNENNDIGSNQVLEKYADARDKDQQKVAFVTDSLTQLFSNDLFPLTTLRAKALVATNTFPALKHQLSLQAMGLTGKLPRLSRGLPL